jgi:YidC/Oxa1 family membrane protein insertase
MVFLLNIFSYSLWWSIIVITILIRLVLLWPQHKMMLSQKKLQAIQPKIKKIQKENKWNQQQIWVKLMALYKKEKVNPMWSCGFMLIQMPILLVMYRIILNIKDPSNTFYIYDIFSGFEISLISYNFFWIDLIWKWWIIWFALALFIWIIQFIQVKLSLNLKEKEKCEDKIVLEKKKWADGYSSMMPDPNTMNKFMLYWMPVMVWFFTYSLFTWVWIYWWMSTLFAIVQQLIVNKVIKKSS